MGRRADDGKRDEWIQRFRRRKTFGLTVESGGRSTAGIALPAKSSPSLTKASFLPVRITQPGEARLASPCIEIRPPNGVRIFVPNSYENIIQRTLKTAHSLPPISAAKRPPATEACFLLCKSCEACFLQATCIH
jgi:hypothetical protein